MSVRDKPSYFGVNGLNANEMANKLAVQEPHLFPSELLSVLVNV